MFCKTTGQFEEEEKSCCCRDIHKNSEIQLLKQEGL